MKRSVRWLEWGWLPQVHVWVRGPLWNRLERSRSVALLAGVYHRGWAFSHASCHPHCSLCLTLMAGDRRFQLLHPLSRHGLLSFQNDSPNFSSLHSGDSIATVLDHSTFWVSSPELVSWIMRSAINLGASLCLHYPLCEWHVEVAPTLLLGTVRMSGPWEINFMLLKYKIIGSWYPYNEHKQTFELQEFHLERLSEIISESQEWHRDFTVIMGGTETGKASRMPCLRRQGESYPCRKDQEEW